MLGKAQQFGPKPNNVRDALDDFLRLKPHPPGTNPNNRIPYYGFEKSQMQCCFAVKAIFVFFNCLTMISKGDNKLKTHKSLGTSI